MSVPPSDHGDAKTPAPEPIDTLDAAVLIGEVRGDELTIDGTLSVPVAELRAAYEGALPSAFAG